MPCGGVGGMPAPTSIYGRGYLMEAGRLSAGPAEPPSWGAECPDVPVGLDGGGPGDGLPALQSEPALNRSFPAVCAQLSTRTLQHRGL